MSWFHHTLDKLNDALDNLKGSPNRQTLEAFYQKVEAHNKFLESELKNLKYLRGTARDMAGGLESIRTGFKDILFMKGAEDDFFATERSTRANTRHIREDIAKLKQQLNETHKRFDEMDRSLRLLRYEEDKIEE